MDNLSIYFIPALFGLIAAETVRRGLSLWQRARTPQAAVTFVLWLGLCMLYLTAALGVTEGVRDAIRAGLIIALVVDNWLGWADLLAFLRRKDDAAASPDPTPPTKTLVELTRHDEPATIDATAAAAATENQRVEAPIPSAKEAA